MTNLKNTTPVKIYLGKVALEADLSIPRNAKAIVLFAHGSGSSRFSPRNRYVAHMLNKAGIATLLMDLLTKEEEDEDVRTGRFRFNVRLLSTRLKHATEWVKTLPEKKYNIGYFGASTGAAAAIMAAVELSDEVKAIVSRGGRPDLAMEYLQRVKAPTLLIVGSDDPAVLSINRKAFEYLPTEKKLEIVQGATHLFEEPGKLEEVARLATSWFLKHLA